MTDENNDNSNNSSMKVNRVKIPSTVTESEEKEKGKKNEQKAKPRRTKISSNDDDITTDPDQKSSYFDPNEAKSKLRAYFVITFAIGTAFIILPLPASMDGSGILRIIVVTILMAVYFFLGYKYIKQSSNTRAVFADSLYYLGFLFTFVALVGAMMELNELNIQVIIGKMGPALTTTVIGMAARIYLTQFEAITEEPETEALSSLGALTSNIISSLKQLDESSKNNAKILEEFQKNSNDQIATFMERLNQIDTSRLENDFKGLAIAMSSLSKSANKLGETSNRTQFMVDEAQSKFDGLDATIEQTKKKLGEAERLSDDIHDLNASIHKSSERIKEVSDRMESRVSVAVTDVGNTVTRVVSEVQKTEKQAKALASSLDKAVVDVVNFLNNPR
jgi:hypothetical protein